MKTFGIFFLITSLFFIVEGLRENYQLSTSHYQLPAKVKTPIKIAQLSDLQYPRLKIKEEKLITALDDYKPDLILLTGDTIDRTEDVSHTKLIKLLDKLCTIAPTYVVSGNHETSSQQLTAWQEIINNSNATLLENKVKKLTIRDQPLLVAGLNDNDTHFDKQQTNLSTNYPRIILAHRPELFEKIAKKLPTTTEGTFIFSGHAHGGQIRLPFIGGLYSPNQGFFPKKTSGFQQLQPTNEYLIISRGLANSIFPLRLNNYPELVFTTLKSER